MLSEAIHVAVPTAFDKDENLDTIATIKHIQHLAEAGGTLCFTSRVNR